MQIISLAASVLILLFADSQNRGVSYIGMCHRRVTGEDVAKIYQGHQTIKVHFLTRTFNEHGCPSFSRIAKDPRPMVLHVSLLNGPGLRNRRLQKHEFLYGYTIRTAEAAILRRDPKILSQIKIAAQEARTLVSQRESRTTVLRIKPILESDFGKSAQRIVFHQVRKVFPKVELIDNPHRNSCLPGLLCETHGQNTEGDIIDLDGLDYEEADARKWEREGSEKVGMFVWKFCNNGFRPGEKWKPPLSRKNWCKGRDVSFFRNWLRA